MFFNLFFDFHHCHNTVCLLLVQPELLEAHDWGYLFYSFYGACSLLGFFVIVVGLMRTFTLLLAVSFMISLTVMKDCWCWWHWTIMNASYQYTSSEESGNTSISSELVNDVAIDSSGESKRSKEEEEAEDPSCKAYHQRKGKEVTKGTGISLKSPKNSNFDFSKRVGPRFIKTKMRTKFVFGSTNEAAGPSVINKVDAPPIVVNSSGEEDPSEDSHGKETTNIEKSDDFEEICNLSSCGICKKRKAEILAERNETQNKGFDMETKKNKLWSGQSCGNRMGEIGGELNLPWEAYLLENPILDCTTLGQKLIYAGLASNFVGFNNGNDNPVQDPKKLPDGETGKEVLTGEVAPPIEPPKPT